MNKLLRKIQLWFQKKLGIYGALCSARKVIAQQKKRVDELEKQVKRFDSKLGITDGKFEKTMTHIRELLDETQLGLDHHLRSRSWGVVCLRGKNQNYVQFFYLPEETDARSLLNVLKQFGPTDPDRVVIDSTPGTANMFYEMMQRGQ